MGRIKALISWLFNSRNNVSYQNMLHFLFRKPSAKRALKYIRSIHKSEPFLEVMFLHIPKVLYCPSNMSIPSIYQVVCETFETRDWHYYQKPFTIVEQGETLLDVGAAEGLFALSVLDKCKQIYLIEPNKSFISSLNKTFEKATEKVEIFNVAAGNDEKTISFLQESINSRIVTNGEPSNQIRVTKIDTLLGDRGITFLKADVEGHELEMLKGAEQTIKRNKPKIAITSYHKENFADEIISLVTGFVPEYKHYVIGIGPEEGKPVMIHFWIE